MAIKELQLKRTIDEFVLGKLSPTELPSVAAKALEGGYDSASLRQLAAAQGSDTALLRTLFTNTVEELGLSMPMPVDAGLNVARAIAKAILNSSVTPYEGARQIWRDVYTRFPELAQLRLFVGLASEYEDDEAHRQSYSQQIIEECRSLLAMEE